MYLWIIGIMHLNAFDVTVCQSDPAGPSSNWLRPWLIFHLTNSKQSKLLNSPEQPSRPTHVRGSFSCKKPIDCTSKRSLVRWQVPVNPCSICWQILHFLAGCSPVRPWQAHTFSSWASYGLACSSPRPWFVWSKSHWFRTWFIDRATHKLGAGPIKEQARNDLGHQIFQLSSFSSPMPKRHKWWQTRKWLPPGR